MKLRLLAAFFLAGACPVLSAHAAPLITAQHEIVFIDSAIPDPGCIAAAVRPGVEWVMLDPRDDEFAQIGNCLAQRHGLTALHLVSHGAPGALLLGSQRLDTAALGRQSAQFQSWRTALVPDADVFIYGCNVARGAAGRRFLEELAQRTGANVAASTNATGSARLGGDWTLEAQQGNIHTPALRAEGFDEVLAPTTVAFSASDISAGATSFTRQIGGVTFTFSVISTGYLGYYAADANGAGWPGGLYAGDFSGSGGSNVLLTISVQSGYTFDLTGFGYAADNTAVASIVLGFTSGGTTYSDSYPVTVNGSAGLQTVSSLTHPVNDVTSLTLGAVNYTEFQNLVFDDIGVCDTPPAFGVGDGIAKVEPAEDSLAYAVARQVDGKLIVAGNISNDTSTNRFVLARLNADGTLDSTFGTGGLVTTRFGPTSSDSINAVAVQPDGKIVAAGVSSSDGSGALTDFALARYNSDGTLDLGFGTGGKVRTDFHGDEDIARRLLIQTDGKIIAVGDGLFRADERSHRGFKVARYTTAGALDPTFNSTGMITTEASACDYNYAYGATLDSAGKLLVVGVAPFGASPPYKNRYAMVRYTTTGVLDAAFGTAGVVSTVVGSGYDTGYAVATQADGKIVVLGTSETGAGTGVYDYALVRYASTGAVDTTFGSSGIARVNLGTGGNTVPVDLFVQSDGKLVFVANTNFRFGAARLTAAGVLDTTFNATGQTLIVATEAGQDTPYGALIQPDDRLVIVGGGADSASSGLWGIPLYVMPVVRLNPNGSLDTHFGSTRTNLLDATPGFISGGAAVVLDSDVAIGDAELDDLAGGAGNYAGASLTLARHGGASADDVFSATGTLSLAGGNVTAGSTTIGTFTQSSGTLTLTYNASATTALVNSSLRQLTYANTSDSPPAAVQLDWLFSDGNAAGAQGTGGVKTVTASIIVGISVSAPTVTQISPTSGPTAGGTSVVITGTNLTSATAVKFGATSATGYTVNSATQITATAPAGSAGTVDVTVTTAGGTSATNVNDHFTYIANSAPTDLALSSASINQSAATAGAAVGTLSSTDADSGDTFTYSLVAGTGSTDNGSFTITGSSLKIGASALAAGTYAIRIQTTDSASNTFPKQFTITVVDNVAPTVVSVVRKTPATQRTNSSTVVFTVTYSEAVTNVTTDQFAVEAVNGSGVSGSVTNVAGSGATRDVTVSLGGTNGEFRLKVLN